MKKSKVFLNISCGVIAAFLVAFGLICMLANFYIMDTERYERYILSDDYYENILSARDEGFASFESVIDTDAEQLKLFFTDEMCKALATEYIRNLFYDLKHDTETASSVVAESESLKTYLTQLFSSYDFSETEHKTSENAVESAYSLICGKVDNSIHFMSPRIMNELTGIFAPFWSLVDSFVDYWALFFVAAMMLYAVMFYVSNAQNLGGRLLGAASSFWCACTAIFMPIAVAYIGITRVKLDLAETALLHFLNGFIKAMGSGMFYASVSFFALSTILLVLLGFFATREDMAVEDDVPILMRDSQ